MALRPHFAFSTYTVNATQTHAERLKNARNENATQSKCRGGKCVLTARVVDFFAGRVINVWNCLPPSVDYSTVHLQLLGVVLTVSILLRPLNATLIEFLVIL